MSLLAFVQYYNTLNHAYVLADFSLIAEKTVTPKGLKSIPTIFQTHLRYGYY